MERRNAEIDAASAKMGRPGEREQAFIARARAYMERGRLDPAIADLEAALSLSESAEAYYLRGTVFFSQEDFDRAIFDLDRAIDLRPDMEAIKARRDEVVARKQASGR
jgi:tetratricopeptide (TPR) repeat protein